MDTKDLLETHINMNGFSKLGDIGTQDEWAFKTNHAKFKRPPKEPSINLTSYSYVDKEA